MIKIGGKEYRNIQEQVAYNAERIEDLEKKINAITGNVKPNETGQYLIMAGDSDNEYLWGCAGITQVDLSKYTDEEIASAIDFDKSASDSFTAKDIEILKLIAKGTSNEYNDSFGTSSNGEVRSEKVTFIMFYTTSQILIQLFVENVKTYELKVENDIITSYINTEYPYFKLIPIYGKINNN